MSEDVRIIHGDCLEAMAGMEPGSVDVVIADPPYGANKADWDETFPIEWWPHAKRVARMAVIITGSVGLRDSIRLVGDDFIDVISARNLNGMTRGPLGFGNWLAAVVACSKPSQGVNAFDFTVRGDKVDHPSPKPIEYMLKLVRRVTKPGDLVLDPFAGSGTTAIACMKTGRRCIAIEREAKYVEIIRRRVAEARTPLFDRLGVIDDQRVGATARAERN